MNRMKRRTALLLIASSSAVSAGPLLDRFMPYTDYYVEGTRESRCGQLYQAGNSTSELLSNCPLDEQTQSTLRGLLSKTRQGESVTMNEVADAIRDLLAQNQPVDRLVDALPPFIRQQLPNLLQSRHCHFLQNGEISAHFDNTDEHTKGEPYDAFTAVTVYCNEVRNFRLLLTGFTESAVSNQPSGSIYQRSSVPVTLVSEKATYPAQVSLLNDGRVLSEQVFTGGFGEFDIPILVRLHAPSQLDTPPKGHGKITGFPRSSRLVIHELN
jgi:hypothetical protein